MKETETENKKKIKGSKRRARNTRRTRKYGASTTNKYSK
jgi:hypothetical protein